MKRDWEIIRAVLLKLEGAPSANTVLRPDHMREYPEQEVAYNMRLLHQAGYLKGSFLESSSNGVINAAIVKHLTNAGHELLDTIRNETVWEKTKATFQSRGIDMTFDLVIAVGKKIMASLLAT